jgi:hypothetical protein
MRIYSLALSLSIACAGVAGSTAYSASPDAQNKETGRSASKDEFSTNQIASAQGGVHLLEHILSRMRNLPQLAISKTKQTIAMQQSQALAYEPNQAQSSNSNLLIKPKGLSRTQMAQMQVPPEPRLIASSKQSNYGKFIDQMEPRYAQSNEIAQDYKDAGQSGQSGVWERQESASSDTFGSGGFVADKTVREYAGQYAGQKKAKKEEQEKRIVSKAPLITEFGRTQGDNPYGSDAAATDRLAQKPTLSAPTSRNSDGVRFHYAPNLYRLEAPRARAGSQIASQAPEVSQSEMQALGPLKGSQAVPQSGFSTGLPAVVHGASQADFLPSSQAGAPTNRPTYQGLIPPAPVTPKLLSQVPPANLKQAPADALGKLSRSLNRLDSLMGDEATAPWQQPAMYERRGKLLSARKAPWTRDLDIALTPPTVITGITLIRLGNSEKEAARSVASLGKTQKELIHGWSVWSIRKHNCSDCAIQVFLKHGIVEAIRIFDPTLLRPELGVTLGDRLSTVKEKFGEPAFILSEPAQLTTQNYIYPISQVGFQLARTRQDEVPKIVSMIVFNVK